MVHRLCVLTLVCLIKYGFFLESGDPCAANNEPGVCKPIEECPYAVQLVTVDEKKPPMCKWDQWTAIVCCPLKNKLHETGVHRSFFKRTNDGVLRSKDMTCRYDGSTPLLCCDNAPVAAPPPEPAGCPPLILPEERRNDLPWTKCLSYQRYVNLCVSSEDDPSVYERVNTCQQSETTERILGGTPANRNEFPHMALLGCRRSIESKKSGSIAWVGGGSLISEKYILTAAHVISHIDHGPVRYALLGVNNKTEAFEGILYNVVRYEPFSYYKKNEKDHDIALLELDRPVLFSEFIRPACLPIPGIKLSEDFVVAGWGITGEDHAESEILLKAFMQQLDYESQCKTKLNIDHFTWNPNTMLCAASAEGEASDTCQGDSGGPLMNYLDDISCSYVIAGIVSWGPRCMKGAPSIYTRVSNYTDWIVRTVWPNKNIK